MAFLLDEARQFLYTLKSLGGVAAFKFVGIHTWEKTYTVAGDPFHNSMSIKMRACFITGVKSPQHMKYHD